MIFRKKWLFFVLVLLCSGKLFAQQNKESVKIIVKENSRINSLAVNAEGNLLLEAIDDSVVLWNASSFDKIHTFGGFGSAVRKVKFNNNSELFLTVEQDNTVSVFSLIDFKKIVSIDSYVKNAKTDASFSADGRSVFTAADGLNVDSYFILLYSKEYVLSKKCSRKDVVYSVDANKNNLMLTADVNNEVQLFDVKNNLNLFSIPSYTKGGFPAVFNADGSRFVCAESEDTLDLRDLNGNVILKMQDGNLFTDRICFSADSKYFAALLKNGAVRIFDVKTGFADCTVELPAYADRAEDEISDIQFIGGSKYIFVCTKKGYLFICPVKNAAAVAETVVTENKHAESKVSVSEPAAVTEVPAVPVVPVPPTVVPAPVVVQTDVPKTEVLETDVPKKTVLKQAPKKETVPRTAAPAPVVPETAVPQVVEKTEVRKEKPVKKGNSFAEKINGRIPSGTFYFGAGYTVIPSKLYIGDFDLDLCFQKYISSLHASIGLDINGGFAMPVKEFPYKYMLLNGKYAEAPWLYTIKPMITVGNEAVSKNSNRVFFNVLGGPAIRFLWNNSMQGCIITKPVISYVVGVSVGMEFFGLTLKASLFYNTQVEFQPSAQVGYTVKYFKKDGK